MVMLYPVCTAFSKSPSEIEETMDDWEIIMWNHLIAHYKNKEVDQGDIEEQIQKLSKYKV